MLVIMVLLLVRDLASYFLPFSLLGNIFYIGMFVQDIFWFL